MHRRTFSSTRCQVILCLFCFLAVIGTASAGDIFTHQAASLTYSIGNNTDIFTIEEARDRGLIIGGHATDILEDQHAFLMKTDPDGNTIWIQAYPGRWVAAVAECDDGNIFSASLSEIPMLGREPMDGSGYLAMTDQKGSVVWQEEIRDKLPGALQVTDHEIVLVGWAYDSDDPAKAAYGYFSRYDYSGNLLDTVAYPDAPVYSVYPADDGGFLLVGSMDIQESADGDHAGYLSKVDRHGKLEWTSIIPGRPLYAITETADGYLMVGGTEPYGSSTGQAWAVFVSADATLIHEEPLPGYAAYAVAPFGNEFLIAGGTGPYNPFIATLSPEGTLTSSKRFLDDDGRFLAATPLADGRVAVGGWSRQTGSAEGWLLILDPVTKPTPTPKEAAGFGFISAIITLGAGAAIVWQRARR
ncbi:MAG: hypothetical protein D5R96_06150 [Methanocalculus sp. MSAO_Arc2]|nr:MAG: hypothetical protein D5R96_06150 [Methanocalculus sp. MSAO_Arc2]